MAERQALDDLLAAINGNPNNAQNASFPSVSPVPGVPISQFPGQVTGPTVANSLITGGRQIPARRQAAGQLSSSAHVPSSQQIPGVHPGRAALSATSSKENNLIELENLLGNRSSSSPASRQATAGTQQMFAQRPVSGTGASRHQLQMGGTYRAGAVDPSMTAGLNRQQLANAKTMQRQRAVSVANSARQTAPMQANAGAQRQREALNSEYAAVMARNAVASNAARNQAQRTSGSTAAAAQRQSGHRNPPSSQSRAAQSRSITQEQIIVGHFCRHAIKTLARVMQNNPRATEAEAQLKDHIKTVWAKWVRQSITRPQLLESVANCVRGSCEAAARIDVIREFKAWYEREYELRRQRTGVDPSEQARMQAQQGQRRNPTQNPMNTMRAPASTVSVTTGNRGIPAIRAPPGSRAMLAAHQKKREAQLFGTGGKRLVSKTIPGRPAGTGRGVAGKTLAGRGGGRGVAGKSLGGKSIRLREPKTGSFPNEEELHDAIVKSRTLERNSHIPLIQEMLMRKRGYENVFSHGDLSLQNLTIHEEEDSAVID